MLANPAGRGPIRAVPADQTAIRLPNGPGWPEGRHGRDGKPGWRWRKPSGPGNGRWDMRVPPLLPKADAFLRPAKRKDRRMTAAGAC